MNIDLKAYGGPCECGREHSMVTRRVVIEAGCLSGLEQLMEENGISGKRCVIYGEHGYEATGDRHPGADQEIVLCSDGLHADENSTAEVLRRLNGDIEVIVAVGSGTIHDIARFCAYERGLRFVSCPTAASVDGFCSTVCSMTWHGYKKTLPGVAPELVAADIDIIKRAPAELVRSGVGDILAKYTALADWQIAHELTGEYLCPRIYKIMSEAVEIAVSGVRGIKEEQDEAYAKVTYALVMSGVAMQMMGNSRPASGAEHHISHMIEMRAEALQVRFPSLHGEKTGVGTLLATREYKRLAEIVNIGGKLKPYEAITGEEVRAVFGEALEEAIMAENKEDCLASVDIAGLPEKWPRIRRIVSEIPAESQIRAMLDSIGAKRELEEIGIDHRRRDLLLDDSPLVRNRLTLMRLRRLIDADA